MTLIPAGSASEPSLLLTLTIRLYWPPKDEAGLQVQATVQSPDASKFLVFVEPLPDCWKIGPAGLGVTVGGRDVFVACRWLVCCVPVSVEDFPPPPMAWSATPQTERITQAAISETHPPRTGRRFSQER